LGQGIVIASSPILTRLYTPTDFGILGAFTSVSSILVIAAALRYDMAIPLPSKDEHAASLVVLALVIASVFSTILGILVWWMPQQILWCTQSPFLGPYLYFLPLNVVLTNAYTIFNYWAIRKKDFRRVAATKLSRGIAFVATQIACYALGPLGLVLGVIASSGAGLVRLAYVAFGRDRHFYDVVTRRMVKEQAYYYRRFPQFSALSALANTSGTFLPVILFAAFYGPQVAGHFVLVNRVAGWPLRLVGESVAQVYYAKAAEDSRTSQTALSRLFFKISLYLVGMSVLPVIVLLLLGPWIVPTIFGAEWVLAGKYAQALAIMFGLQFVTSSLSQTLNVLQRQSWVLAWDLLRLVMVVGGFVIASHLGYSSYVAVVLYSITMSLTYVLFWSLCAIALRGQADTASVPAT
jgi:O-antigen/teichoic acid export membrane protein